MSDVEPRYARECPKCNAITYQYERCHACGDVPWKDGGGDES